MGRMSAAKESWLHRVINAQTASSVVPVWEHNHSWILGVTLLQREVLGAEAGGEMLSLQKCEADAKDPVVTRQTRERTQHLCNAWQVFRRDSTQPIASALVLRECCGSPLLRTVFRCGKGLPVDSSARSSGSVAFSATPLSCLQWSKAQPTVPRRKCGVGWQKKP